MSSPIFCFKHSQYKTTWSLQDFSGKMSCSILMSFLPVTWLFFFFFPLPLHFLLSFIVMYIAYLAELQRELAGNQDNLSAQAAVRWWLSRGTVCLRSLLQRCSLTSFLEANLVFDIECVHSSSSSLFWWKGGCVLLWTSKHGVALQKLITQGTEALCDLRIMRLNLRRQLAIL